MNAYKKKYGMVNNDGYLYLYKKKSRDHLEHRLNLLTSQVRLIERGKLIELTTTDRNKPYILMAENENLTTKWISVLANARQSQLQEQFSKAKNIESERHNMSLSQTALNELTSSVISEIQNLAGNKFCADCRKMDPDWLSVNLGILVCIECSGPHRSLGVNFSKIQSLFLDEIGTASLLIARKMGNELFNEAYEGRDPGQEKPLPESSIDAKRHFIRSKYVDKAYVVNTGHGIELVKDLAIGIQNADMYSIVQVYAEVIIYLYTSKL